MLESECAFSSGVPYLTLHFQVKVDRQNKKELLKYLAKKKLLKQDKPVTDEEVYTITVLLMNSLTYPLI